MKDNLIYKIKLLDAIRELGNIVTIKLDGERDVNPYSIIITFQNKEQQSIRFDGEELGALIEKVIERYLEENEL